MLRVGRTGWTWTGLDGEKNGIYKVGRWEKLAQKIVKGRVCSSSIKQGVSKFRQRYCPKSAH